VALNEAVLITSLLANFGGNVSCLLVMVVTCHRGITMLQKRASNHGVELGKTLLSFYWGML